jgi:hypothetical protein
MNSIKAPLRCAMLARGERLAEFLNCGSVDAAEELLAELVKLQRLLDRTMEKGQYIVRQPVFPEDADRKTGLWCWWASDKKVAALLPKVNGKLVRYGWKVEWMVELTRQGPPTVPLLLARPLRLGSKRSLGLLLRDCLEDRALGRVRSCMHCRQWFVAVREDQSNCSKRCRNKCGVHATPAKWAAYHRRLRRIEKERGGGRINATDTKNLKGQRNAKS